MPAVCSMMGCAALHGLFSQYFRLPSSIGFRPIFQEEVFKFAGKNKLINFIVSWFYSFLLTFVVFWSFYATSIKVKSIKKRICHKVNTYTKKASSPSISYSGDKQAKRNQHHIILHNNTIGQFIKFIVVLLISIFNRWEDDRKLLLRFVLI